jgi:predicted DNA-binding transcriptional regulator AlpA
VSDLLTQGASSSKLLTPEEVAERLAMTKDWVYARSREWVKSNGRRGIPTVRLGRFYRYRSEAIARWEPKSRRARRRLSMGRSQQGRRRTALTAGSMAHKEGTS